MPSLSAAVVLARRSRSVRCSVAMEARGLVVTALASGRGALDAEEPITPLTEPTEDVADGSVSVEPGSHEPIAQRAPRMPHSEPNGFVASNTGRSSAA